MATTSRSADDIRQTIQQRIDRQVDSLSDVFLLDEEYEVVRLARDASRAFGTDRNGKPNRSQMRKLERVALSASTYSEVVNYVKSQAGRDTKTGENWRSEGLAYNLNEQLQTVRKRAENRAHQIIDRLGRKEIKGLQREDERKKDAESRIRNQIEHEMRLRCVQRYVSNLVAEYAFHISREYASA